MRLFSFLQKNEKVVFRSGLFLFWLGLLDPMEGSVLIATGSAIMALVAVATKRKYYKSYLLAAILIFSGVNALFVLSSFGGFGGTSDLSWWWGVLILPYPVGWLMMLIVLLAGIIYKKRNS